MINIATLLEDLVEWIQTDITFSGYVDGMNIFRDYEPAKTTNAVILREYDSILSPFKGNEMGVRYIQVSSRNSTPSMAKALCDKLFSIFMCPEEEFTTLPSGRIILSSPKQSPFRADGDINTATWIFNVAITTNPDEPIALL